MYKLSVQDRNYKEYKIFKTSTMEETEDIIINPLENKIFNQDVFNIINEKVVIEHSMVHYTKSIPGILILEGNKTYGKKNRDKFFYKCVPDDSRLPFFLVSYCNKKIGFNKYIKNKFTIFKFIEWTDKHPVGEIISVIGDVDILENFYEYQLYRKSLNSSINEFTKYTLKKLKEHSEEHYIDIVMKKYKIQDRRDYNIFTIDPLNSKDFDDAFSIIEIKNGYKLSIYIANVYMWFDVLDLWKAFSNRISTIYLPDRKRPMLPNVLSDSICSLKENCNRFSFVIDIIVDTNGNIIETEFLNALINVKKNFIYDELTLLQNHHYWNLFELIQKMNIKSKYISDVVDSHDVIAYIMTLMNYLCAKKMIEFKIGIFRGFNIDTNYKPPEHLDEKIRKFLLYSRCSGGVYEKFSNNMKGHDILDFDAYVNITSPIRRLIDLLNMTILMEKMGLIGMNTNSWEFLNKWMSDESIEYINKSMRSIKKVQCDCNLLALCYQDENIYEKIFKGCIFDMIIRSDGLKQHMVYLPEIKMLTRYVCRDEYDNFSIHNFKLYLFKNKDNMKQKIRLEIIS
jgi:exoribonuclease R